VDQHRQACAERGAEDLEDDEHRHRRGGDPGEGVAEHAGDGGGGVGELHHHLLTDPN
jgi:hypothetical protein